MIIDSAPPGGKVLQSGANVEDNNNNYHHDQLRLNPGAPERKPRSAGKFCLWLTVILVCLVGGIAVFFFIKGVVYQLRHPHSQMYYDKGKAEGGVMDWSMVVQPMIRKEDEFDVVASVWVRDDDDDDGSGGGGGGGKDGGGGLYVDGEERPERVIYTGTIFKNVNLRSKHEFNQVTFPVPISHFKRANISNYDLRASFVLVQHQPWWLERAQRFSSWVPQSLHAPAVRPSLGRQPTLADDIFNSFGFTIPLIEFHNITGRTPTGPITATGDFPEPTGIPEEEEWDEELELLKEAEEEKTNMKHRDDFMDIFRLEFTGDSQPATSKHPFIVTRTHLGIVDETEFFKRQPYNHALKGLANATCDKITDPVWYQCQRWYYQNGVFETRVQMAYRSDGAMPKKNKWELLYAPYLNAIKRSAGPKDLVPVPLDREALAKDPSSTSLVSVDDYVNVTWRVSFKADTPGKHMLYAFWDRGSRKTDLNMTASDDELTHAQYEHDLTLGLLGYRIDEGAHPRRAHVLSFISFIIRVICWFLTIHYWYTRTSTAGISRLGATLVALYLLISANEDMLTSVLHPEKKGHWLSKVPLSYIFLLISPFVRLKAVSRLEFGSSGKEKEKEKKRTCPPQVYFAKATHLERASERVEMRVSKRAKLLFLISLFGLAHFCAGPYTYFITPRISPPPPKTHPLQPLSDHLPRILHHVDSLSLTFELGGMILQFIMNMHSRTYAGKYKLVAILMLIANGLLFLDLVPRIVGTSARIGGVFVREVLGLGVCVVDVVQVVKYRSVKVDSEEGEE